MQALQKHPEDFRLHFALGRLYEQMGMHEMADEEDAFCEGQGEPFHRYILGVFKEKVRATDYKQADILYRYVAKRFPDDPAVLLTQALKLHKTGNLKAAEYAVRRIIELGNPEPGTFTYLGQLLYTQGDYKGAIACFNKELAERPAFEGAIIGKSKAFEKLGRYRSAYDLIINIYRDNPVRPGLADTIANCLVRCGYFKLAVDPSVLSLAFAVEKPALDRAKRRLMLILPVLDFNEVNKSLQGADHFLEVQPELRAFASHYHFAMGDTFKKMGLYGFAIYQFRRGLGISPDHAKAYAHLGDMALMMKQYDRAKGFYEEGVVLTNTICRADAANRKLLQTKLVRLNERLKNRKNDFAWRFKDAVEKSRKF